MVLKYYGEVSFENAKALIFFLFCTGSASQEIQT